MCNMSNHHTIHCNYLIILFVNYMSIKLKKKEDANSINYLE